LAAQLACNYFLFVLLEDLQTEIPLAEGTGQDIKKIAFHGSEHVSLRSINLWPLR
jgi:hypothetical protein